MTKLTTKQENFAQVALESSEGKFMSGLANSFADG